jgi:hypothetical protein
MMVDLALLQSVSYIAGALGVCVAAIFYVLNLRISQKNQELTLKTQELALKSQDQTLETRQAQLFMGIYETYYSNDFRESDYELFNIEMKNIGDWNRLLKDRRRWAAFWQETLYFTGIGVLVRQNLIDIRLVTLLLSESVFWYWEKYRDGIMECRKAVDYPRLGIEVEYLYNRISDYAREHPQLGVTAPKVSLN